MMQGITNSLNIQRNWSSLLLDIAKNIIIILDFYSGSKGNLDGYYTVGSDYA